MNNDAMKDVIEREHFALARALYDDPTALASQAQRASLDQIATVILEHIDPTEDGRFAPWLLKQYSLGYFKLGDTRKLRRFLRSFLAFEASQFPSGHASALPNSFYELSPIVHSWISNDETQALAESRILHQKPDGFTVAVPRTEFAAKWWGLGTKWPSSHWKNNEFHRLNEQSPMIVMKFAEGTKLRMALSDRMFALTDEEDRPIDLAALGADWRQVYAAIYAAVHLNPDILSRIPSALVDQSLVEAAVRSNYHAMRHVPPNLWTPQLCALALSEAPGALYWLSVCAMDIGLSPEVFFTQDQYEKALEKNGDVLRFLPSHLRSEEFYRIAISNDGFALIHLPRAHRSDALCELALSQNGMVLQYIPHEKRSKDWCRRAVEQEGKALFFVPRNLRDAELYLAAVRKCGKILSSVPVEIRTPEICEAAVLNDPRALNWVPEKLRSPELCRSAVSRAGYTLTWVPQHLRTRELCSAAVTQDGLSLAYVPFASRSEALHEAAIRQNGEALEFIVEVDRTRTLCEIALEVSGSYCHHLIPKAILAQLVPETSSEDYKETEINPEPFWKEELLDRLEQLLEAAPPPSVCPATEPVMSEECVFRL
jgi:hypothetical protein